MFRKLILTIILLSSFSFSMSGAMVEKASKDSLGCIKGLGVKRVESIVIFRKSHSINTLEDLLEIKGIGKGVVKNIRNDIKKKVCTSFSKKSTSKKKIKKISAE